jgi:hypothetical protein
MPGGRPTKDPKTRLIAVRVHADLVRFLEARARKKQMSVSETLRGLIRADKRIAEGRISLKELLDAIVHNVLEWQRLSVDLVAVPEGLAQHARDLAAKFALVGFFARAPRSEVERAQHLMAALRARYPLLVEVKSEPTNAKSPKTVVTRRAPTRTEPWNGVLREIRDAGWNKNLTGFQVVKDCINALVNKSGLAPADVPEPFRNAWPHIAEATSVSDVADPTVREQVDAATHVVKTPLTHGQAGGRGRGKRVTSWGWAFQFARCFNVRMPETPYAADRSRSRA